MCLQSQVQQGQSCVRPTSSVFGCLAGRCSVGSCSCFPCCVAYVGLGIGVHRCSYYYYYYYSLIYSYVSRVCRSAANTFEMTPVTDAYKTQPRLIAYQVSNMQYVCYVQADRGWLLSIYCCCRFLFNNLSRLVLLILLGRNSCGSHRKQNTSCKLLPGGATATLCYKFNDVRVNRTKGSEVCQKSRKLVECLKM